MPMVDNPYLSISINREDLGSSFRMGVDKKQTNLEVLGESDTDLRVIQNPLQVLPLLP